MANKEEKRTEDNSLGHESNLASLREGNIDHFPETNAIYSEAFNYKKEDNVKDVKEENNDKASPSGEGTNDQKGGNVFTKSALSIPSKIALTLVSTVTAVVAIMAVVPKTTSPTISGVCSFLDGTISCHLLLQNPSSINLTFLVSGKSNGFSYEEPLFTSSDSSNSSKQGIKKADTLSSSSSSEETLVTFDRDVTIPDYSNYDVYIKGNIGYGETTYYHSSVSKESDGVAIIGDPSWNNDGTLQVTLSIDNPKDYDLVLYTTDSSSKTTLLDPISLPKESTYSSSLAIPSGHDVSLSVKASKGYSSRDVYFRSVAASKTVIENPYDIVGFFFDKYLVYGLSLKEGKTSLGRTKLVVKGDDDDYSLVKELTDISTYKDTLTLDASKHYSIELYAYYDDDYHMLTKSDSLSSEALLSSPKVVGMNRTLFLSYDSTKDSYGDVSLNVYDEARTKLLGTYPFRNDTYCVLSQDGPYSYDISANFPFEGSSTPISKDVYSSSITTDEIKEPSISEDSRANDNTLYYSLSSTSTDLVATYTMYIYSSSTKEKAFAAISLGTDPSLWAPGLVELEASSSYYYEVVAATHYGNKTYLTKEVTNESGVVPKVYGEVYASGTTLSVDVTSNYGTLGSTLSIAQSDGTSLYNAALVNNAYSGKFTIYSTNSPYSISVSSDKIGGNTLDLFSTNVSSRNDLYIYTNPGVYEVPSKKLFYSFIISPDVAGEVLSVISKGMKTGVIQRQSITLEDPSTSSAIYSGSFSMNEEDQIISVNDASGNIIYYAVKEYRDDIAEPTVSGVNVTFNDHYGNARNIPVKIDSIVNPSRLPLEVATVPYDSSGNIMDDYDQASSVDGEETSFENTDIMVPTTVNISYVVIEVRLNQYLGGDVYWKSDHLNFT